MVKRKTTFAEDIANLLTPAPEPEIDPEREDLEDVPVLLSSDDELVSEKPSKGRKDTPRLRGSIDLGGAAEVYTGKRSSRKDFFQRDEKVARTMLNREESEEEEEELDDDDDDDVTRTGRSDVNEEADLLEKEMLQVEEAEAEAAEEMRERAQKEYRKALCVRNQKRLWNASLEARIMMQRVIQGTNMLPCSDMHPFLEHVDASLSRDIKAVSGDARDTLVDMCAVLDALAQNNPATSSLQKKRKIGGDSSVDECWRALDERYQSFSKYRDMCLDRWHRKTILSAGSTQSLKILNQGISKQVGLLMKDRDNIAARSRVPMNQYKGLCQLENTQNCETGDDLDRTAGNELVGAQETYYDGEFYQALLTEFLEGSSDQVADHKIHKEPKNRKIVDRRASKGRKIRYHVHEKLVNFMAPDEAELPEYASRIFANLFGHKRQPEE